MKAQADLSQKVRTLDHPLAFALLSLLRQKETAPNDFRPALQKLATFLLIEAARSWETNTREMVSPLSRFVGQEMVRPVALIPILRAGLGLQEGMMPLVPEASSGHIGLYRDPETLRPIKYYSRLPTRLEEMEVLVLDPMLATGHSAEEAISIVKSAGATRVQFVCALACPFGIEAVHHTHPEVPIIAAAVDPELNEIGYIVPGLGDAGDRYFGTG
jgi:uracil phosphoribosyltransferase